ncbi:glycogen debranching protein GlgX [Brachybacterium sp. AOP25-B2-12]|uniref:glycogen debranching protein GlgX n=1 Tax=Brachybacterium sp. AOP25-B2-12 TaxID=3457710 RepID=UPI004033A7E7
MPDLPLPSPSRLRVDAPASPGLHVDASGRGTFGVVAPRAHAVDLCILRGGAEQRVRLRRFSGGMWWDEVRDMTPGTRYGLRVEGPWDPVAGKVANPARLLLDPRAGAVSHASSLHSAMFAHEVDALLRPAHDGPLRIDRDDDADVAVWSVVADDRFAWEGDVPPRVPWPDTVLYEAHVRGLTALHPEVPAALCGTYAGLEHPAVTSYLRDLGITSVELLPIHAAMDEAHLARMGLTNYWGYSTLSFFAPDPALATDAAQQAGPQAVVDEVRSMVRGLHAAGLEVILDVVYNHTAEGGADGPSLSLRGLDAREFYWMDQGDYEDFTGTGATLDMRSVHVMDLVLDSLRHWVTTYHVDGFRFDLAATLGRDDRGFRPDHPLLRAMTTDPVLRHVKLIAEPWDVGGYGWQTGSFPPPFAEWNDAFRDDVRSFWLADPARRARTGSLDVGGVRNVATRLAGSADLLTRHDPQDISPGRHLRAPWAGINYVTAHDGFTLRDLTTYDVKHNEANGEHNRDGTDDNRSWNHGHEGEVSDADPAAPGIRAERLRTARGILSTLLLAAGTPMLTAGDEFGRTQRGNNNAYCQDNEISWVHWDLDEEQEALLATTRDLLALRHRLPRLRPGTFLRDADPSAPASDQVAWFGAEGEPLRHEDWFDPRRHTLQMLRPGDPGAEHLLLVVNGADAPVTVRLPGAPWTTGAPTVLFSSAPAEAEAPILATAPDPASAAAVEAPARTVLVLELPPAIGADGPRAGTGRSSTLRTPNLPSSQET